MPDQHPVFAFEEARGTDAAEIHTLEMRNFSPADVFSIRRLRYLVNSATCTTLLVRHEGFIVAGVMALRRGGPVPSGRIYKIVVDRSMRGRGLASRLLQAAEDRLTAANVYRICAEVRQSNDSSRHLFEKHGYQHSRTLNAYYADGEDGIKFWKTLIPRQK
jgi:ribosomal protein S18 acetylase RimI-like enzyme